MTELLKKHWHHFPEAEVTEFLDVHADTGLDQAETEKRREKFGSNILTLKKGKGPVLRFLLQFHQALVYILLVAIGVKIYLGDWVAAGVIFGVVLLNAIIGFVQEGKAWRPAFLG
ncbi:cation-transporting P-type ATPase [methane-oxidizing endosymbiont of Gigantopelta aegis]|uniref:cation-transporting P-type ATPase n=1 Tax=methane-oxidizing endosymbiont of Gigantopelta aegis TaxID=2794938 RepID=UPI0018DE0600|nr:cation-transporting P-type ATPase [methane-oxidizing endosymbiont of Gigantopelta aegis]